MERVKLKRNGKKKLRLNGRRNGARNYNSSVGVDPDNPYFIPLGEKAECNDAAKNQMVYYIERLLPVKDACALIGLFENTHYRWMRLGKEYITYREEEEDDDLILNRNRHFADYYLAINRAIANMRKRLIDRSFEPDSLRPTWVRDMTILERRDRENWSRSKELFMNREEDYDPDESFL